jgi:hypothetical protein
VELVLVVTAVTELLVLILMNVKLQLNHVLLQLLAPIASEVTLADVTLDIQETEKLVQTLMSV